MIPPANYQKFDIEKIISATMSAQDANLSSVEGQAVVLMALLAFERMLDMHCNSIEIGLDMTNLTTLMEYSLAVQTDAEASITKVFLTPKVTMEGLTRGN